MKEQLCDLSPRAQGARGNQDQEGWGYYLYGVISHVQLPASSHVVRRSLDDGEPVEILPCGQLDAVVSRVPLAEFSPEKLTGRLEDPVWVKNMVLGHARVIDEIHRERTILPAKFGAVYRTTEDVATALETMHNKLVSMLIRLEACDEFGVRLYVDREVIEKWVMVNDPESSRLNRELTNASPGRAYLMKRSLAEIVREATSRFIDDSVYQTYERLLSLALDSRINRPQSAGAQPESEILNVSYLVQRTNTVAFTEEAQRSAEDRVGLRCEYCGPFPPYNFAELDGEVLQ